MNRHLSIAAILAIILCCFVAANAQTASPTDDDKVYQRNEVDKQAVLLEKPRPRTDGRCKMRSSGTIRFELILRRSGQVEITNTTQTSSCEAFDKSAYNAAKGIKFTPAIKDGQPVSVAMWVYYSYSVY